MNQKFPAHIFFGIVAFTMITLAACTPTTPSPSTTTATTAPPVPPTVTATPDASRIVETPGPTDLPIKPVDVYPFCTSIGNDKTTHVKISSPVNIVWGWNAKTEEQVNDFLENSTTTITLDGKVIEGYQTGNIFKNETRNDYEVLWIAPIGIMEAGQHTITYDVKFTKQVEDGTSVYGPGTEHESGHDECFILVE
jgi:hypothetical protein